MNRTVLEYTQLLSRAFNGAIEVDGTRIVALALVWVVAQALGMWWTRELGGLTGDTYGALCEIAEVVALAILSSKL